MKTMKLSDCSGRNTAVDESTNAPLPPLDPKNIEEGLMNRVKEALKRIID